MFPFRPAIYDALGMHKKTVRARPLFLQDHQRNNFKLTVRGRENLLGSLGSGNRNSQPNAPHLMRHHHVGFADQPQNPRHRRQKGLVHRGVGDPLRRPRGLDDIHRHRRAGLGAAGNIFASISGATGTISLVAETRSAKTAPSSTGTAPPQPRGFRWPAASGRLDWGVVAARAGVGAAPGYRLPRSYRHAASAKGRQADENDA